MKITFLVSGNIRSNFSYRAFALARALHKQGHDVSLITPKADKYNHFAPEAIDSIDGVKILQPFQFTTNRPEINLLPYLFGAANMVLQEKPDLIYIYKPTPVSVVGLIGKLFQNIPVLVDMDDLGSEVMKIEGHPLHQRKLVEWSERIAVKYADRLVVASSYLLDKYRKEFPGKPIHVMPNGVEGDWLSEHVVPSEEKKRIVFMGAINRKNILESLFDVLPEIIKKHSDVKVLIIGDGNYLEYFKEKAVALGIFSNVEFTGWLDIAEARLRLRAGDIGYNYMPDEPTTKAASNMKISQYLSRGVVPLVSDIGDLPAMVDFGKAGYIAKPDNVQTLKAVLLEALDDKDRSQKARQANTFASEKLNWDQLASDFYQWIAHKRTVNKTDKNPDKKKIYMVATSIPGDFGGSEIRNYNLAKQWVKQADMDVEIFCISPSDAEPARKNSTSDVGVRYHIVPAQPRSLGTVTRAIVVEHVPPFMEQFKSSGIGDAFRKACEESLPDIVQIEQLHGYYCIREHIGWLKSKGVRIILDCHNIEFQGFQDSLELFSFSKKLTGEYLVSHLKNLEIEAARQSDVIFTCSTYDADFFKQYNEKTYVIPNGVDCSVFPSAGTKKNQSHNLIFMGGVKYPPNGDAVEFYLNDIHPKVKEHFSDIKLLGIGVDSEWLHSFNLTDPSVEALGFVEDVKPYLEQAVIGICPVRHGSGTRIKIMTYMAAGLPVVSTSKGAEGVTYRNGHDIIITDDPGQFAEAIVKLLNDQTYRDTIAQNGRNFILEHYDWNVIGTKLASIYNHEIR